MAQSDVSNSPVESVCPLCGSQAKKFSATGDWSRYDCPQDKTFDITGTAEAEAKASEQMKEAHRDRVARERKRGIKIPKVGSFPAK